VLTRVCGALGVASCGRVKAGWRQQFRRGRVRRERGVALLCHCVTYAAPEAQEKKKERQEQKRGNRKGDTWRGTLLEQKVVVDVAVARDARLRDEEAEAARDREAEQQRHEAEPRGCPVAADIAADEEEDDQRDEPRNHCARVEAHLQLQDEVRQAVPARPSPLFVTDAAREQRAPRAQIFSAVQVLVPMQAAVRGCLRLTFAARSAHAAQAAAANMRHGAPDCQGQEAACDACNAWRSEQQWRQAAHFWYAFFRISRYACQR
jgi:hypothetical protein